MFKNKIKTNIKTGNGVFDIILESRNDEKGYTVRVPKLPEIVTGGKTIQEAKKMAKEAIEFFIECLKNEHHSNTKSKRSFIIAPTVRL